MEKKFFKQGKEKEIKVEKEIQVGKKNDTKEEDYERQCGECYKEKTDNLKVKEVFDSQKIINQKINNKKEDTIVQIRFDKEKNRNTTSDERTLYGHDYDKRKIKTIIGHKSYNADKINTSESGIGMKDMNIKHLKLFKLVIDLIIHLYLYLYKQFKQFKIMYNLNINIQNNDTYSMNEVIKYYLVNMTNLEKVTELWIKLPVNLYNSIAVKTVDITFNDDSWLRLEQLLNILCNITAENINDFDVVWWNMQTCWTAFKKNPNDKCIKEFTVNCEAISEDEEQIMVVYTIIDGKSIPINVEIRPKQELIDLINEI